jgi:uncharacterized membrane protein YgdD (TMEM256/DUF423 family)
MRKPAAIASVAMALAVACGAFGAHALRDKVPSADLVIWEKSVFYHFMHAFSALFVALVVSPRIAQRRAAQICALFLASTCVFSGSLYFLVLLNQRWLGMITPLGGLGFIAAWLMLAAQLWREPKNL